MCGSVTLLQRIYHVNTWRKSFASRFFTPRRKQRDCSVGRLDAVAVAISQVQLPPRGQNMPCGTHIELFPSSERQHRPDGQHIRTLAPGNVQSVMSEHDALAETSEDAGFAEESADTDARVGE